MTGLSATETQLLELYKEYAKACDDTEERPTLKCFRMVCKDFTTAAWADGLTKLAMAGHIELIITPEDALKWEQRNA